MPHFDILTNDDGSIATIFRDGVLHDQGVTLEPAHQIVSIYFKIAATDLESMRNADAGENRRASGLQAFLMSLTGVEAFTNVFFQQLAMERENPALLKKIKSQRQALVDRIEGCLALAFDDRLPDQEELLERLRKFYQLRNQIVHPRWQPASMRLSGEVPVVIHGMSQNFQTTFEDESFCREAFWWCVKFVAEVGKAVGNPTIEGHCFFWAGIYGLTNEALSEKVGLERAPGRSAG